MLFQYQRLAEPILPPTAVVTVTPLSWLAKFPDMLRPKVKTNFFGVTVSSPSITFAETPLLKWLGIFPDKLFPRANDVPEGYFSLSFGFIASIAQLFSAWGQQTQQPISASRISAAQFGNTVEPVNPPTPSSGKIEWMIRARHRGHR